MRSPEGEIEIMAGNLPVPNTAEVKLVWTYNGSPYALNILHYTHEIGASMTQALADSISTTIKGGFTNSGHGASITTAVSLARVEARHMDSNSDPWFIGAGAAVPGSSAGHPLPAATSFVVSLKTGLRGRSFNGRVYLWGYTEDANDALGGITTAASAASVAFITSINPGAFSGSLMALAIVSRFTTLPGAAPGTPATERNPPIRTPVSSILALDTRWDVQRRRAIPGI